MSDKQFSQRWKHVTDVRIETLDYIKKRRAGLIRSVRTPWVKLNSAFLDGLEWGSIYVLGGRPGTGKTSVMSQITNNVKLNNPTQDIAVLNFQFEMSDRIIGVRELTKPTGMSMKKLLTADPLDKMSQDELGQIEEYYNDHTNDEIYYVTESVTPKEFTKQVIAFYKTVKKPIIVTVDHSVLTKKDADESSQLETLYNLSAEMVYLKKIIPDSMYIILSQMNRSIDDPTRKINGTIGNYPTSGDLFAADALMQNADGVILINRPDIMGLTEYGPEKIKVEEGMLVFHIIKNRFNELSILFFQQDLQYFDIKEGPAPISNKNPFRANKTKP
jgi:replicative DNA helicase